MSSTESDTRRPTAPGTRHRTPLVPGATVVVAVLAAGCAAVVDHGAAGNASTSQVVGRAQAAPDSEATAVRVVRYLDQILRHALVAGDTPTVDNILALDFVDVEAPNDTVTRARYVAMVASGDLDYRAFRALSPVQVRVSGTRAVVSYTAHVSVTAGGVHTGGDAWQTHVYEKGMSGWREVRAQSNAVNGPAGLRTTVRCKGATQGPSHSPTTTPWPRL